MKSLALVVAGVLVTLGVVALVLPEALIGVGRDMVSPAGLWAAAAVRVGSGLVLMLAARWSRSPGLLRAIGAVVLVGGMASPLFGVEAARARLDWEAAHLTFFVSRGRCSYFSAASSSLRFGPAAPSNRLWPTRDRRVECSKGQSAVVKRAPAIIT